MRCIKPYIIEKLHINKDINNSDFIIDKIKEVLGWFIKDIDKNKEASTVIEKWADTNDVSNVRYYVPDLYFADFNNKCPKFQEDDYFFHKFSFPDWDNYDKVIDKARKEGGKIYDQVTELKDISIHWKMNEVMLEVLITFYKDYTHHIGLLFVAQ